MRTMQNLIDEGVTYFSNANASIDEKIKSKLERLDALKETPKIHDVEIKKIELELKELYLDKELENIKHYKKVTSIDDYEHKTQTTLLYEYMKNELYNYYQRHLSRGRTAYEINATLTSSENIKKCVDILKEGFLEYCENERGFTPRKGLDYFKTYHEAADYLKKYIYAKDIKDTTPSKKKTSTHKVDGFTKTMLGLTALFTWANRRPRRRY